MPINSVSAFIAPSAAARAPGSSVTPLIHADLAVRGSPAAPLVSAGRWWNGSRSQGPGETGGGRGAPRGKSPGVLLLRCPGVPSPKRLSSSFSSFASRWVPSRWVPSRWVPGGLPTSSRLLRRLPGAHLAASGSGCRTWAPTGLRGTGSGTRGPVRADGPVPHPGSTELRRGGQPGPPRWQWGPSTFLPDTCRNQNRKAREHLLSRRGLRREWWAPRPHLPTQLTPQPQPTPTASRRPLGHPEAERDTCPGIGRNATASVSAPTLGPTLPRFMEMPPGGQNRAAGRTPAHPE